MILIIICITVAYLLLIGSFAIGFDRIKTFILDDSGAKTTFSVIIPFKNEAENLSELLQSILSLNYPDNLFEVILVNDESNDGSVEIINSFIAEIPLDRTRCDIRIINNDRKTNSPKKDAINTAISQAKFDWIVTTDADCVVPEFWLDSFDGFIQKNNPDFIVAPVRYHKINSFLERFQTLDFLSLIGATIGGFGIGKPFLCNGANLGYKKSLFNKLNGFEGNTNIASGDDIFLLEKALKFNSKKVQFLKSKQAVVKTKTQSNIKNLLSQRIRWAAKTSSYNNLFGKLTGVIVLLMNASIVCSLLFVFIGLLNVEYLGYIFVIKFSIDFLLIYKAALFFNQEKYLTSYLLSSFIYPFFSVYVAIVSVFKGYSWKGNYYKK